MKKVVYGSPDVVRRYTYDGDQVIEERNDAGGLFLKFYYGPGIDEPICMHRTPYGYGEGAGLFYYHYDGLGSVVAISDANGTIVERYEYDVFGRCVVHTGAGADGVWMTADDITDSKSALDNPYMFTGRRYDGETGLYYYRARYYNPYIGRFMQPDPVAMYMQYASVKPPKRGKIPGTYLSAEAVENFLKTDPIGRFLSIEPAGRFLQTNPFGFPVELNLYTYCGNNPIIFIDPYGLGFWGDLWKVKGWVGGGLMAIGGLICPFNPVAGGIVAGVGATLVVIEAYEYFTHPPGEEAFKDHVKQLENLMDGEDNDRDGCKKGSH